MNQSQEKLKMTTEQYLKFERASEIKHEYLESIDCRLLLSEIYHRVEFE